LKVTAMLKTAFLLVICMAVSPAAAAEGFDAKRVTVRMVPGITSWQQVPTDELRDARRALGQGRSVRSTLLRQLADLGDGFAALRFAQRLDEQGDAVLLGDIAHYYGIAAATGRGGAINGLIGTLDKIGQGDLSQSRLNVLKEILLTYANAGNSYAVEAILRFQTTGSPFGPLDDDVIALLGRAQGEGTGKLALQVALDIMQKTDPATEDLIRAQAYLATAMTARSVETQLVAKNLVPLLDRMVAERLASAPAAVADPNDPSDLPASEQPEPLPEALTKVTP
jgi:hypothetical protein